MNKEDLKNEYLAELHKLLNVYISKCIAAYGSINEFVNAHIVSGSHGEYRTADSSTADSAVKAYHDLNQLLPVDLKVEFTSIFFNEDMQLAYVFNLLLEDEDGYLDVISELVFIQSATTVIDAGYFGKTLSEIVTEEELQAMLKNVKSLSTFGLIKNS